MRRSDFLRPTFRVKLLIALLGTVGPLLLVTLLVVRREAHRQVETVVAGTLDRAETAFIRIERIRQEQLAQLGARAAGASRWSAALQTALEGDTAFLHEIIRYELELTGFANALAAFTNLSGEPIAALINGKPLADPASAVSTTAIDRIFAGDTAIFGYHLVQRQLFSIHPVVLNLVQEPIGILLLGLAIDDETAQSLGQALGANVCFAVADQCVASSGRIQEARHVERVTRALPGAAQSGVQIVLDIPLDDVVRPFDQIQASIRYIGLAVLLLAIVVAVILSRGFAQPVRALVAATSRVARGEYDTHVTVRSRDEMGMLADAFNEMTHGLMLKEKYRGVLDKVVSRDVADEMLKGEITLGGETREVTTLFADIRGFTAMSEGMAPQEVVALLNEIMEAAEEAVVAEGGVVDKYVGDEIMALFGAPMSRGDDAGRAVRAALRMQGAVAAVNARRPAGSQPLTMGIGINTGDVVAGNMGSARRLNYTVLGAPVNLAARLCSAAAGGQTLLSRATLERVQQDLRVAALGTRAMKGISQPVEIFEVIGFAQSDTRPSGAVVGTLAILWLLASLLPAPAAAQHTMLIGPVQVDASARLDLNGFVTADEPAWLIADTTSFVAGRATGMLDVFAGRHLYGFFELRADRGEVPTAGEFEARIEQAFLRVSPFTGSDASIQVGRFVSPFGNWPQRHHSESDPLIRPPLSYDYRTVVSTRVVPAANDGFLSWKDDPDFFRPRGAPPVWAAPYQLGAMLLGSIRKASWRIAVMNAAPSTEPDAWNDVPALDELNYIAHLAYQLTPELRLGVSYGAGAYLDPDSARVLPAGQTRRDYRQTLTGIEATVTRGLVELRGELIHDAWQVPSVTDRAIDLSWYVEGKLKLAPGLFTSGRVGAIHFNELRLANGTSSAWDYDIQRIQIGAGYRVTESIDVRAEVMLNRSDGPRDPADDLLAVQATWLIR